MRSETGKGRSQGFSQDRDHPEKHTSVEGEVDQGLGPSGLSEIKVVRDPPASRMTTNM